ncbi:MAG: RNase adapter RapZ [Thermodesulfobacterium sp.]|nr:RNase adapter RapZ [Thermodesulfobacterium sp.]
MNIVIITGLSGSGKSTALKALEDLGYLSIDNFPIRLLLQFLEEVEESLENKKVALVMDIRDKYFLKEYPSVFEILKKKKYNFEILFLDARSDVIITRFNQTRRIHPLMKEGSKSLKEVIEKERELLRDLKEIADLIVDTSDFNVHQLRNEIFRLYRDRSSDRALIIHLIGFGYKYGIPSEASFLFDVRFLPNPYFVDSLKPLSGKEDTIKKYLLNFPETLKLVEYLESFLEWLIPFYYKDNKQYLTIGIGCTGGRHRSPAIIEILSQRLKEKYPEIEIVKTYRDIEKDVYHQ